MLSDIGLVICNICIVFRFLTRKEEASYAMLNYFSLLVVKKILFPMIGQSLQCIRSIEHIHPNLFTPILLCSTVS